MKNKQTKLLMSMAVYALLNTNYSHAVQVQSVEAQELEDESFLQIDAAFDDAFEVEKDELPSNRNLLQLGGTISQRIEVDESESSDSDSDSEPMNNNNLQRDEETGEVPDEEKSEKKSKKSEDSEETEKSDKEIKEENQMKDTSNAKDSGKIAGYSPGDDKINMIFDDYTGADNDEFMKQLIEDYGTKEKKTLGNPKGIVLTKYHGERATRRFINVALKVPESKVESWIKKNFNEAWSKYDVLCNGTIDEAMIPTYFRSLLGDFTTQFKLNDEERYKMALKNE